MQRPIVAAASIAFVLAVVTSGRTLATTQRSFVASYGNDANPCTLTLPCRAFAAAIAQTIAGGEVIVLDSAGYGTVTITQSVSIIAPAGVYAGVTVPGAAGITMSAGATDIVTLRGLTILNQGFGVGISLVTGGGLTVDRCVIHGPNLASSFSVPGGRPPPRPNPPPPESAGVKISGPASFLIRDSVIDYFGEGVVVGDSVSGVIERSTLNQVNSAVSVGSNAIVTIDSSLLSGVGQMSGAGIAASMFADTAPTRIHVSNTRIRRFLFGILGSGIYQFARITAVESELTQNNNAIFSSGTATISLSDVRVTQNQQGVEPTSTGVFTSGTNYFRDNVTDGPMIGPVGIK